METSKLKSDVDEIDDLIVDVTTTVDSIFDINMGIDVPYVPTITISDPSSEVTFQGEITIIDDCETIKLLETLKEQKMQIEALSEIIADMAIKKDFNIEYDLEKRVEQKRFLNKLGGK